MIKLSDFRAIISAYAKSVKSIYSAVRCGYNGSDEQITDLVEYILLISSARKRDVWSEELIIRASDVLELIQRYFRERPPLSGKATAQYLRLLPAKPVHARKHKHEQKDDVEYLFVEFL